jgi:SAM-dependent methyltransferase
MLRSAGTPSPTALITALGALVLLAAAPGLERTEGCVSLHGRSTPLCWPHTSLRLGGLQPRTEGAPYTVDGVFQSGSSDLEAEVEAIAGMMQLAPGSTYCEVGAGNGLFMTALGHKVMPGGRLIATGKGPEVAAMTQHAADAGLSVEAHEGTDTACGLPAQTCDLIFSRMVYHMLAEEVALAYLPQLASALRPGGKILILDHHPDNGGRTRADAMLMGMMPVVPEEVEIREGTAAGLRLLERLDDWPYFGAGEPGYALVWGRGGEDADAQEGPSASARS